MGEPGGVEGERLRRVRAAFHEEAVQVGAAVPAPGTPGGPAVVRRPRFVDTDLLPFVELAGPGVDPRGPGGVVPDLVVGWEARAAVADNARADVDYHPND